jgi:hypothetical protein
MLKRVGQKAHSIRRGNVFAENEKLSDVEVSGPFAGESKVPEKNAGPTERSHRAEQVLPFQRREKNQAQKPATVSGKVQPKPNGYGKRERNAAPTPTASSESSERGEERVSLIGRIGRYPVVKRTQRGVLLAVFSVGTDKSYKDAGGKWQKKTEWQRIVVWGDAARAVSSRLQTGAKVYVEGRRTTREWTDRENKTRTSTEVIARDIGFVDMPATPSPVLRLRGLSLFHSLSQWALLGDSCLIQSSVMTLR